MGLDGRVPDRPALNDGRSANVSSSCQRGLPPEREFRSLSRLHRSGAAPDEWPASPVVHKLSATVLDIAIPRTERSTWRSHSRTSNATDHRTHRATDHRTGHDPSCCSGALLRRLAGRDSETDQGCKDKLAHGDDLLRNHQGTAWELTASPTAGSAGWRRA